MRFEEEIKDFIGQPLTRQLLMDKLKRYKRPYDKISELVNKDILIPVRRGLFVTGPALGLQQPEPFLLANHILGPSYVSLESAMNHWGIIPERVFETASVTTSRTTIYNTHIGRFSYTKLPLPYYAFGQQRVDLGMNQVVLIARPEKAICDKIIATSGLLFRSTGQLKAWLTEDMRMEKNILATIQPELIQSWAAHAPKKNSILLLAKTLEEL